jgi:hypothetical protein
MGIFGTTYVFDVLHAFGRDDVALKALTQTTYPSFGYMISQVSPPLFLSLSPLLIFSVKYKVTMVIFL